MNNLIRIFAAVIMISCLTVSCSEKKIELDTPPSFEQRMEDKLYPEEGHMMAKNYPEKTFAYKAYEASMSNIKKGISSSSSRNGSWVNEGPGNIGGRINTIAIHPENSSEMMLGYGYGGVFKTENNGEDWFPVFDNEDITTISDVKYDPNDGSIVYVGTGDLNISGYAKNGRGIFKSINGGQQWERMGLEEAGIIAEVGISKANSEIIYAASMGIPFLRTNDRGLYKSTNGGEDWEHVFFLNDSTGVIDIEVHPEDPNIVYAATWTRIRNNEESRLEGDQAGIFKTIDGGETWTRLTNGLPEGQLIRPGLAMFEGDPDVIYSMFVHNNRDTFCTTGYQIEGVYKTSDAGTTWAEVSTGEETGFPCDILRGFGWYFGQIRVSPMDENFIYVLGVDMYGTKDGGQTWNRSVPSWSGYAVHADKHDLVFEGTDMILATDGGAYRANLFTEEWEDIENIVSTQFYRVGLSPHAEGNYFGGAQDNGTTGGNELAINEWPRIFGGDGFQMIFHPTDPNIYYVETQNGSIRVTFDGGESYQGGTSGLNGSRNWDMQYIMSSANPSMLYTGTNKMFRSISDERPEWVEISGNLTDTLDTYGVSHNITTLDESPVNPDLLYCGTSDGFVWRSLDFGETWDKIIDGLPRRYISDIKASKFEENTVYLTIQGYKDNDNTPYVYKSVDNGDTWVNIQGDMPQIAINDILLPPTDDDGATIFVGTDGGVFYTLNGGVNWERMGDNMPIFPVFDLEITPDNKLVAGTFARGIYTFDLIQLVETSTKDISNENTLNVYPTVAEDYITIEREGSAEMLDVIIVSLSGEKVFEGKHRNGGQLDVRFLSVGTYVVNVLEDARMFLRLGSK
jgi:photosystem II stability/assembly factor-like uncharacterized protein